MRPRLNVLIAALALATAMSCGSDEDLMGPDGSEARVTLEGITYATMLEVVNDEPFNFEVKVKATNTSDAPVRLMAENCMLFIEVYDDESRTGEPVWDQAQTDIRCTRVVLDRTLQPGESHEFEADAFASQVLGTSLISGIRYFLMAALEINDQTLRIPAGDLVLEREPQ